MKEKRPALGKGLSALFPANIISGNSPLFECPLGRIVVQEGQPRTIFDEAALKDLADSIRESGIIQPLVVTELEDEGLYSLIAGERRLRAARMAGLSTVPVVVRQTAPGDVFVMALVENIQREDLNPVEQARAYRRLVKEFGMTQEQTAKKVGRRRSTVANSLRLLKLSDPVLTALEKDELQEGTARALIGLDGEVQVELLASIQKRGLTTRDVEKLVKKLSAGKRPVSKREPPAMSAYFSGARREIEEALDLPVNISFRGNKGKLSISFNNLAQFRQLRDDLARISGNEQENDPSDEKND